MFVVDLYHQHVNFHDEEMFIFLYFKIHCCGVIFLQSPVSLHYSKVSKSIEKFRLFTSTEPHAFLSFQHCVSGTYLKQLSKVKILWEGHKIWKDFQLFYVRRFFSNFCDFFKTPEVQFCPEHGISILADLLVCNCVIIWKIFKMNS